MYTVVSSDAKVQAKTQSEARFLADIAARRGGVVRVLDNSGKAIYRAFRASGGAVRNLSAKGLF